jgi:GWxTD domain-containing protein
MIFLIFLQIEWQVLNRPLSDSLQELAITFTIPSNKLKFIADDSLFYTQYETRLKVFNEEGSQVAGDYWQAKQREDTLDITDSVKITVPKTSAYFNLKIIDLYGGEIFDLTDKIIPINYLADIQWLTSADTLHLRFMVINPQGDADHIIVSVNGIEEKISTRTGSYTDSLTLVVQDFPIDTYTLTFQILSSSRVLDEVVLPIKISKPFFLDEFTWSLKVEQLQYIATPSERNQLKNAPVEQRDSLWYDFWKEYDPTPNTPYNEKEVEYFERIQYCEEHFSHGDRGWRSDRARIYVKHGPPDEILSRTLTMNAKPYEVWYYYSLNLQYIFIDRYGFGQYILINPLGSSI